MKRLGVILAAMAWMPWAMAQTEEVTDTTSYAGYEELDELVIEAERPVIQTDGAKLTYNVDEDPAATSSSALDILKKVPQVSVDPDGNILLNGSSAFKLQVNGFENPMFKQYAKQVMEGMPASMIRKIEVITEPGAKEDAEGVAGIINIVTDLIGGSSSESGSNAGISGSASLRADKSSLSPSLYLLAKKNKFTISANGSYQWAFGSQKFIQESSSLYQGNSTPGMLASSMGQSMKHQYANGSIDMSWEPNPSNLFTAGANITWFNADIRRLYGTTGMLNPAGTLLWQFSQDGNGRMKMTNVSANASYRHNFATDNTNYLVLSYLFNFGAFDLGFNRWYLDLQNYNPDNLYSHEGSMSFNRGHTVQADYANDFKSEHHLLEVGFKGIFRHNTALTSYAYGNQPDLLEAYPWLDSNILQPQNIYAGYASYTGTFDKFGVLAGLRFEHTLMGITDRIKSDGSFRNHLNDWVPNAALSWNFSSTSNLRLAYQMRISRPGIEQVNPFVFYLSPFEIRTGNPDLTSEHRHMVSLKYSGFGRVLGGSIGLEYNLSNDAINSFAYLMPVTGGDAIVTTYANTGKQHEAALTAMGMWTIIRNMSLGVSGRLAYNTLKSPAEGYRNHGWGGNIGANWNYTVADVYKFSAYGMWSSRAIKLQGYSASFYYYGISASRDCLADKSLTVGISATNFLQRTASYKSFTETPNVINNSTARNLRAWNVALSVTWKFGSLSAKVKNTGIEVKNDDISTSSNKGQSGI